MIEMQPLYTGVMDRVHWDNQPLAGNFQYFGKNSVFQCGSCHGGMPRMDTNSPQKNNCPGITRSGFYFSAPIVGVGDYVGPSSGQWLLANFVTSKETKYRLASDLQIAIDGKNGRLNNLLLDTPVDVTIGKDGLVRRINTVGVTVRDCFVEALDPANGKLAVGQNGNSHFYQLDKEVCVSVDEKEATLNDLKAEMPVTLQFSAIKREKVIGIQAIGPTVECFLKQVEPDERKIAVSLKKEHLVASNLKVPEHGTIVINGHPARLGDLRPKLGFPLVLRMSADPEGNQVVGIEVKTKK
jgi:hypothetical protein